MGKRAQGLLQGDLSAYDAGDRSATLTGFMREVQGTENWLIREGLKFEETAQELGAVDALSTLDSEHEEHRREVRILETIPLRSATSGMRKHVDKNTTTWQRLTPTVLSISASVYNPAMPKRRQRLATGALFVLRGYDSDHLIFACEETGLEHAIRCNALNKQT